MAGFGFARHAIEIIKSNRALKTSSKKGKIAAGKSRDGKKSFHFEQASNQVLNRIKMDKVYLAKQLKFRLLLLSVSFIFAILIFILFYNFG